MASIDDYLKAKVNQFTSSFSKRPLVGGLVGQGVNYVRQQAPRVVQQVQQVPQNINNQMNWSARQQGFQNSGQLVQNLPRLVLGNSPQQFTNYVQNVSNKAYKPIIGKTASNIISDTVGGVGRNLLRGPAGLTQNKSNWEKAGDILATGGAALAPLETLGFGVFNAGVNKLTGSDPRKGYQQGIDQGATFAGVGKWLKTEPMVNSLGKYTFAKTGSNLASAASRVGMKGLVGGLEFGGIATTGKAKTPQERWENFKSNFVTGAAFNVIAGGLGEAFKGRFSRAIANGDYETAQKILNKTPNGSKKAALQGALNKAISEDLNTQNLQEAQNIITKPTRGSKSLANNEGSFFVDVRDKATGTKKTYGPYSSNRIAEDAMMKIPLNENEIGILRAEGPSNVQVLEKRIKELRAGGFSTKNAEKALAQEKAILVNRPNIQSAESSFTIPETKPVKKLGPKNNKQVAEQVTLPVSKPRGFTESVKEAPNVKPNVKQGVTASYKVKPNSKLMGEAEALLHEGVKLNFTNVKDADRKVAATIQEAINQQRKNPQAAANLFNNLSEQGTELGRGVQAFSLLKKMTPESIALSAAGKIKRYNMTATRKIPELTGEQVSLIAKRVDALNRLKVGSREHNIAVNELYKTINEFIPSSIGDKAITVWKAGLLTSLRTHERNLIGNTLHQGAEIVKDIPANLADRLMSARTGQRTTTLTVKGLKEGGRKGMQAAKDIISSGYDPEQAISKYDVRHVTWGNNPVEQGLKKYTDIVFRTLGAADKPFWNAAYARSLYDQAGAQAINAGKRGDARFIEALVKKPTEEMLLTAAREANVATFHDKNVLSSVVNAAKQQLSKNEYTKVAGEVLAPFTGVPSSIAGQMVAYSPVGLIKGALKVGKVLTQNIPELQRQAAQEVGRGAVGAGLWGLGAYLVSKGLMTGQPKDQKEADQWQIEGKQANSVLIGGKWRSINSIGPEFLILLAGAKFQQEMSKGEDANVGSYLAGVGKDFMSQTFLQGVQGPLNALNDPQRFGKSYVGGQISSVIPNIVKDTSKALDPFQRETNSVLDYMKNSIPGVRNQGVPKRDVLGNELPQEPTGINAYIDLFNSKTPIKNNVIDELSRLNTAGFNAVPSKLNKTQTIQGEKTVLTPEQLDSLEKFRGPVLSKALEQLFQSSSYQAKSDQDKADAVDTVVKRVNKYIRGEGGAPTFNSGETSKPLDTQEVIKPKTIKTKTSKTPKAKTLKASKARKPKKVKALKLKKVPMAKFKKFKTPKLASKQIKYAKLKKPKTYRLDLKSLAVKV